MAYAPGRWSSTFEEQLTDADMTSDEAFTAAAIRGFREELGGDSSSVDVSYLGAIMEMPILNPSIVMVLTTSDTFTQVRSRWQAREKASKSHEIVELASMDISSIRPAIGHDDLHPTAEIRLALLARRHGQTPIVNSSP